nr:Chain E, Disulfide bond formation protein B [Burkholderia pseudomallei]5VYO_F Chain F, Disulfide bond formation protein B [Burkholderia pseudomallei]5VYO_G Chain G, Disulfide bond formation protein B [Burkholderia pseudomallei]5VYO_H Chain H, Disulfide bond formation protein B [Burkholderia pseudomallei]
GFSCGF